MIEKELEPYIPDRFLKDERYRNGHISVIHPLPGVRIMGVHIPEMKKLAASFIREEQAENLIASFEVEQEKDHQTGLYYEEKQIWGMIINRLKIPLTERLDLVRRFIPAIDNWAVCDTFCTDAKWIKKNSDEVWRFLDDYFCSDSEFKVRFAIVASMYYYLDEKHIQEIYSRIAQMAYGKIHSDYRMKITPYYVYMAAGWLMATALHKLPETTRAFANSGKCPPEILKLYVRKAKESFRTKNTSPF